MRRALLSGVTVLAAVVGLSGQASQPNSSVGTWKLNLAKSKFEPASLAPKSMTSKIEAVGDRTRNTTEGVDANGRKIAYGYTISYDGKDYPITGTGPSGADTIAVTRVDPNTLDSVLKKAGKVVQRNKSVYTKTTRTITSTGTGATGEATHNVAVYDRQ